MLQRMYQEDLLLGKRKIFRSHLTKSYLKTRKFCAMAIWAKQQQEHPDV